MNQPSRFSNHFKSIAASLACLSILFLLAHGEALRTVQRALAGNAAVTTAAPKRNAAISHVTASAQTGGSFTLSETVIAGGGGYSSGGAFALQSTSGQSLAAISTGGAFSYESGFGNGVLSASMSCVATLTVNDAGDGADVTPGDGVCETATGNGICTLRAAIEETNALTACGAITINFNIPGGGVKTIAPTREFPIITHTVTLDATTQPGAGCTTQGGLKIELNGANAGANAFGLTLHGGNSTVKGFVINRFAVGLYLETAGNNRVQCNYLGTDVAGLADLGNGQHGVVIREIPNNTIGGTGTGERNIISGNDLTGVFISGAAATGNIVSGNYIGVAVDGTTALGNSGTGVHLTSAPSNRIEGNLIIGNGYLGVSIIGTATGNAILGNAIFNNADLGIDLDSNGVTPNDAGDGDTGPNNLQNFPVLSYASSAANAGGTTNIQGTLNSPAATSFRIEFFVNDACNASGYGEGQSFLGFQNVTTNGNGDATINFTVAQAIAAGKLITTTATRLDNSNNPVETSEFSACRAVTVPALSYNSVTVAAGAGTTNPPTAANNISGYAVQSQGTFTGTVTVNAAGVVSISNAAPVGTHTITISGMGTSGIVSATFTLTVTCPTITINPATLPNVTSGVAYTQQLTGSGGAGAYNFTVSNGALPTGLQLSPTGLLSGTPTVLGPSSFTITAVDANNCRGSVSYSFNVICPTITVNPAMLPAATLGVA
ncbi:MAG TPA: putative Ig domain-containing protein, partial [Blastocatellia bacterium]|nr:putative Ig domain-containing protein [Blastocatellia bacterium]